VRVCACGCVRVCACTCIRECADAYAPRVFVRIRIHACVRATRICAYTARTRIPVRAPRTRAHTTLREPAYSHIRHHANTQPWRMRMRMRMRIHAPIRVYTAHVSVYIDSILFLSLVPDIDLLGNAGGSLVHACAHAPCPGRGYRGRVRHTPHATRHTPHATRHTPHATRHTPYAIRSAYSCECGRVLHTRVARSRMRNPNPLAPQKPTCNDARGVIRYTLCRVHPHLRRIRRIRECTRAYSYGGILRKICIWERRY
jgi:hypothetical protein